MNINRRIHDQFRVNPVYTGVGPTTVETPTSGGTTIIYQTGGGSGLTDEQAAKLAGIEDGAQKNQNAISKVTINLDGASLSQESTEPQGAVDFKFIGSDLIIVSLEDGNIKIATKDDVLNTRIDETTEAWVTSKGYTTETWVNTRINEVISGAPDALDTLYELAAALGNDPNFSTTVLNKIGTNTNDIVDLQTMVAAFQEMFEWDKSASPTDKSKWIIKAKSSLYSVAEVSAYGYQDGEAPTGAQYMYELKDVLFSDLSSGQLIQWNGSKWVNIDKDAVGLNESELASYLTTNNYAKKTDITSKGYATEGWVTSYLVTNSYAKISDITWVELDDKPSWIGSTKPSYSYSEITGTPTVAWVNVTGRPMWIDVSAKPTYTFAEIKELPTTLEGYGIVDGINALVKSGAGNAITGLSISGHTLTYTTGSFIESSMFNDLFEKVNVGTASAPVYAIKAKYHLFSVGEVSAYGFLEEESPTGAQYMYELKDVTLTDISSGQLLQWNGSVWVNIDKDDVGLNESELAAYLTTNNYAKISDITWSEVDGKPTWIGSTKPTYSYSEISNTPTSLKNPYALTIQRHGVSVGSYDGSAAKTLNIAAPAFSEITGKPTTLSGYGITDGVNAVSVSGSGNAVTSATVSGHSLTLTKGTTFLTSHQSLANYVTLNTAQTITGKKSFSGDVYVSNVLQVNKQLHVSATLLGTYDANRSEISLVTAGDYPCDLWLGANGERRYSISARTTSEGRGLILYDGVNGRTIFEYKPSNTYVRFYTATTKGAEIISSIAAGCYLMLTRSGGSAEVGVYHDIGAYLQYHTEGNPCICITAGNINAPKFRLNSTFYNLLHTGNYSRFLDARYRPMNGNWAGSGVPGTRNFGFVTDNTQGEVAFLQNGNTMNMVIDGDIYCRDQSYIVWHAGNDGSGSGLDADLLDGLNEYAFLRYRIETRSNQENTLWEQIGIKQYNNALPDGLGGAYTYGVVVSLPGVNGRFDFYCSHYSSDGVANNQGLYYRSGWGEDKRPWRRLATTEDNIASATKLQTARTINGTSFDGTANIVTSYWGTTRYFYINSHNSHRAGAAVSVNGNGNVTLLLPDTISCSNWFRSTGNSGWHSETYGGGIWMSDYTYVKVYNKDWFRSSMFSAGNAQDDSYSIAYNATATSGSNWCCYSMVRSGIYAFGMGFNTSNEIWLGVPNTSRVANNMWLRVGSGQMNYIGSFVAQGEVTAYSDVRLKSNITDLTFRGKLRPRAYIKDNKQQIGFVAQEVQALYPELILETNDESHYLALNYGNITAVLSSQINVIDDEVTVLKKRIKQLENKLEEYVNSNK